MIDFIFGVYIGGVLSCVMLIYSAFIIDHRDDVTIWHKIGILLFAPWIWFAIFGYILYDIRRRRLEEERCANLLKKFYAENHQKLSSMDE